MLGTIVEVTVKLKMILCFDCYNCALPKCEDWRIKRVIEKRNYVLSFLLFEFL